MKCRHCSSELTTSFIDLGSAPPSNAYLSEEQLHGPEIWLPLKVLVCDECKLVQTEDFASRDTLFTEDYAYFSSFSKSWLDHSQRYVSAMIERYGLNSSSHVVEVASNDGYLLQYVAKAGIPCLGIEPTASTAAAARKIGIETIEAFFGVDLGERLSAEGRGADLTVANNVLAHVPDINDFVGGFAKLLKPNGVSTFEFPHVLQLVTHGQFDTIYHEHFSYLSLLAVERIFMTNGLSVFDVESLPTHGGSLRVFAQRSDAGQYAETESLQAMRKTEADAGMDGTAFYAGIQGRAETIKDDLIQFLIETRRAGKKVGAYGAAAKGNTLMNFAGIRPDLVPYVVDLNPAKAGKFMPGSRIPIVGEDHLLADKPDYILILPWNLKNELMAQLACARDWGGQFVVAVPELTIN